MTKQVGQRGPLNCLFYLDVNHCFRCTYLFKHLLGTPLPSKKKVAFKLTMRFWQVNWHAFGHTTKLLGLYPRTVGLTKSMFLPIYASGRVGLGSRASDSQILVFLSCFLFQIICPIVPDPNCLSKFWFQKWSHGN